MRFFLDTANLNEICEADVETMPFKVMVQLFNHPLTHEGVRAVSRRLAEAA